MATRVSTIKPGASDDPQVNTLLQAAKDGWWNDAEMMGVIGRRPELLKAIVPVFESFFAKGIVEPYLFELMRLKTGEVRDCTYCSAIRVAGVRDLVAPKEPLIRGVIDVSGLTRRESLAVELAQRMAQDPHSVDDAFWLELEAHFSEDELVELAFACAIFNWGNTLNITMRLDASPDGPYSSGMQYRTVPFTPNGSPR